MVVLVLTTKSIKCVREKVDRCMSECIVQSK
jgi:hypothetical protein